MNKKSISAVVLTHNDENIIVDTLECLKFADEIIIIDDESTDHTIELARQFTGKVFKRPLNGSFASQRNFALNHVHGDWVLFIDSDERVSNELKEEILKAIKQEFNGFYLKRVDVMWGKKILYGEVGETKLLRLARKNTGKWKGNVHETWRIRGARSSLQAPLTHVPHQSVSEFLQEIDTYSTIRANQLLDEGKKIRIWEILIYPLGKFVYGYIILRGFKDGIPGFIYATMMSFHSFLVRGKTYLNSK